MAQYGVRYDEHIVRDNTWACEADVLWTYHYTDYVTAHRGVTGVLVTRPSESSPWEQVHP